jgi:hypothetical protein
VLQKMIRSFCLQPKYFKCASFVLPTQDRITHLSVPEELQSSVLGQRIFLLLIPLTLGHDRDPSGDLGHGGGNRCICSTGGKMVS